MEYNLEIDSDALKLEVAAENENELTILLDGRQIAVHCTPVSENRVHLILDDGQQRKTVNAYVADTVDGKAVSVDGIVYTVQDMDAVSQQRARKGGGNELPDTITPPMPAIVVSILVRVGDRIGKGQGVVVVSAMKMETTLKAPYAGTVTAVHVNAGDKVTPGDVLVDIEEEKESA